MAVGNPKISVVVPVYNAGRYVVPCLRSLLRQSLPPDDYEIVFVDDASTDDTPARLDAWARRHARVRVHHEPVNSGWPGRPRNVGVDLARGEYVQFVDQDDELAPEALERLYALAHRNRADIVLGKVSGTMTGPSSVFRRTVERCTVADEPLVESLTPHKMFRRDFLRERRLRFAEGRRRLEDQLFMVQAYLAADHVSILGDYPCYVWKRRDDGGNTSKQAVPVEQYFANLGEVLDAIEERTEPGDLRNWMFRRFYRNHMVNRFAEPRILRISARRRKETLPAVRRMIGRFPAEVAAAMPTVTRLRARLIRAGRLHGLMTLARRCHGVTPDVRLTGVSWEGERLVARAEVHLRHPDGAPVTLHAGRDGYVLDRRLTAGLTRADFAVTDPLAGEEAKVLALTRDSAGIWWFPATNSTSRLEPVDGPVEAGPAYRLVASVMIDLSPRTLAGGSPADAGTHGVFLRARLLGIGGQRPLRRAAGTAASPPAPSRRDGHRIVRPEWQGTGQLAVTVLDGTTRSWPQRRLVAVAELPAVRERAERVLARLPRRWRRSARRRLGRLYRRVRGTSAPRGTAGPARFPRWSRGGRTEATKAAAPNRSRPR